MKTLSEGPNAGCKRLYRMLRCSQHRGRECQDYFDDRQLDHDGLFLLEAHRVWPDEPVDPNAWLEIAYLVHRAIPVADAAMVMMAAIEAALRGSACRSPWIERVQNAARTLQQTRGVERDLHARITAVLTKPETLCWKP